MNFKELKTKLKPYFSNNDKLFKLPAKNDLKSTSIEKLITDYLPKQSFLEITITALPPSNSQVIIKGTALIYPTQPSAIAVQAIFEIKNNAPVLTVTTQSLAVGWTLGSAFPSLKDTVLNSFGFTKPTLILASWDSPAGASSPVFKFGLNFNGTPTATGPLKPVQWLLPDLNKLILSGVITFSKDKAILSLAVKSKQTITIKPVTIKVGIQLTSQWLPANTTDDFDTSALLTANVEIGSGSNKITLPITMTLFSDNPILLTFQLAGAAQAILSYSTLNTLAGGGDFSSHVPSQLPTSNVLNISALELVISPKQHTMVSSVFVEVSLNPKIPWTIIPKVLSIAALKVNFTVLFGAASAGSGKVAAPNITSTILGRFEIGSSFQYDVSLTVPGLVISGSLAPYSTIKVGELLQHFLKPITGTIDGMPALEVYKMDLVADFRNKTYSLAAAVSDLWTLDLPLFKLSMQQVIANINYSTNELSYDFAAYWVINDVTFITTAAKPAGDKGWNLSVSTMPGDGIDLITIAKKFLQTNITFPPFVPKTIKITDILITLDTNTMDYSLAATTLAEWDLDLGDGYTFSIKASIDIQSSTQTSGFDRPFALITPAAGKTPKRSFSGTISGEIQIWQFSFTVEYAFFPDNKTLTFTTVFKGVTLTCVLSTIKNKQTGQTEKILKVNLGGISFGGILEFLVNLVNPNLGFRLSSPWDVLNQINFDNLNLEINLTRESVGFTYNLNLNLVLIDIQTIGLAYVNKAGRKTVDIIITGDFVGQTYDSANPLQWDLLNDPPPSPPGKGTKLLDLRYLGFGQNITFRETKTFTNVQSVITALEQDFKPVTDDQQNPLAGLAQLKFSGDGQWLIGADFTLMDTVSLMAVFNDPTLYGLRVALAGERAKALAGLQFEILYKKVTETIGVYHIELKLPDAMRQIQMGAASLTLPIIDIDIYTNGNFRIDMGFPIGLDFSRSFCLQWLPFIGYGGFYFALLNGQTSDTVPKISNGEFSPVIEFGLGVSVGVGKTIDKGILSAGATLTVVGIIEGTLAWFNPSDGATSKEMYFRIQGTGALVGKLYGSVNFFIIKADVSVEAYASATILAISYEPIEITLEVGVEVSVSIKILFIRVHFSFKMTLELSFTIGSKGDAPWHVVSSNPAANPLQLRQQRTKYSKKPMSTADLLRMLFKATGLTPSFNPQARNFFNSQVLPLSLVVVPTLTTAIPATLFSNAAKKPSALNSSPEAQAVMSLFIDNSIDPNARHAADVLTVTRQNPQDASFNRLVAGTLLWMLNSLVNDENNPVLAKIAQETVTVVHLEAIQKYLSKPANRKLFFTYANIISFIKQNFILDIGTPMGVSGPAASTAFAGAAGATGPEISVTVFPMIPHLDMSPQSAPAIDFNNYSCVSKKYIDALEKYFDKLQLNVEENVPKSPGSATGSPAFSTSQPPVPVHAAAGPVGCTGGDISMATVIFQDYFAMLAKASVNSALNMLKAYPYFPTGTESLYSIAQQFGKVDILYTVQPGDTIAGICGTYGISPRELRANNAWLRDTDHTAGLNPGDKILVSAGVTPTAIAVANADYPLNYIAGNPVRMTIEGVKHQVRSGDTLAKIIHQFGISQPGSLFTFIPTNANQNPNASNTQLLQPKAKLEIPPFTYTVPDVPPYQRTLLGIGSFYWVRNQEGINKAKYIGWYKQQIAATGHAEGTLIKVPIAQLSPQGGISLKGATGYRVQDGDTVDLMAGYLQTMQLNATDKSLQSFINGISGPVQGLTAPVAPGAKLFIPSQQHDVQAGDTFENLSQLFTSAGAYVGITGMAAANRGIKDLIQSRAVVALPTLDYPIGQHDTFANVAAKLDLSLEELALSVTGCTGIFSPGPTGATAAADPMKIPDVPAADVNRLLKDLVDNGEFNNISAMVSRFLMHGLRVPAPGAKGPVSPGNNPQLWGLYEVVGQQFPAPSITGATYNTVFSKGSSADWICFQGPSGASGCAAGLTVSMEPAFLNQSYPGLTLKPEILTGPTAMPLYQESTVKYAFQQDIHWQSSTTVNLAGPTGATATGPSGTVQGNAGQPSIWLFPDTLTHQAASLTAMGPTASTSPYDLYAAASNKTVASKQRKLQSYSWATAVPLRVQRVPAEAANAWMPNSYVISGADETGRDTLLKAWKYLDNSPPSPNDRIYLLYQPGAAGNNSSGLASDKLNPLHTFLLKTNLSTLTHSNNQFSAALSGMSAVSPSGEYYARIQAPADFIKYVWEASITGTGGFYLNYVNAGGGEGLPAELFANSSEAVIWMVLLLDDQTRVSQPQRRIYPFNNCAVLAENLDASSIHLYAALQNPTAADYHRVSTVPAGSVGFHLTRTNPDPGLSGPVSPTQRDDITRSLYNLVGYKILPGDFTGSPEGLPIGPAINNQPEDQAFPRPFYVNSDPNIWSYSHILPAYRFGKVNNTPSCTALPSPAQNPYRGLTGISGLTGAPRPLSTAKIQLAFHDVYGNKTLSAEPMAPIHAPYGYTDEIIAVNAWPGIAFHYLFSPPASGATAQVSLDTGLAFQVSPYIPGSGISFAQAAETAASHAERYKQVFYQAHQPDLQLKLGTNLGSVTQDSQALKAGMLSFVSSAAVFVHSALQLRQQTVTTKNGDTAGAIAKQYAVTVGALAVENQDAFLTKLFTGKIVFPKLSAAPPGNSLVTLSANQTDSGTYPPSCTGPNPAATPDPAPMLRGLSIGTSQSAGPIAPRGMTAQPLTPQKLAENNKSLPLSPGTTLRTLPRNYTLPANFKSGQNNLAAVAASLKCNVYTTVKDPANPDGNKIPIGFFVENFDAANLIAPGITLKIKGFSVSTTKAKTLDAIVKAFKILKLSPADIALAIENTEGLLLPKAKIKCADYIVPQPPPSAAGGPGLPGIALENLPKNSGSASQLATLNRIVTNFFAQGVPVYINYSCKLPGQYDSFATLAMQLKITIPLLAQFNQATPLKKDVKILIPNLTVLDKTTPAYASYSAQSGDSLDTAAALMGTSAALLAEINRYLPGIFLKGARITIGTTTVTAKPLDSLQTVFVQFNQADPQLDFKGFIAAVQATQGLYSSRVILAPLPKIPDNGGGTSASWAGISKSFNILPGRLPLDAAAALLQANASMELFLRKGAVIQYTNTKKITVGAYDTVDTIIGKFKTDHNLTVSIEDIARDNLSQANLLTAGNLFLLPPNPAPFQALLQPKIPPAGTTAESAFIFPVNVTITMTREKGLVNPDFLQSTPVYQASGPLTPQAEKQENGSISLTGFAKKFEAGFAPWQLKCAVSKKLLLEKNKSKPGKLFAVNFGPAGVSRFALQANAPQFYALRPLSTSLMDGTVAYHPYQSGSGLCTNKIKTKKFEAIDLDSWMQQFFSTLDLVLTSPYAMPAFSQGATGTSTQHSRTVPSVPNLTGPSGFSSTAPHHNVAFEAAAFFAGATGASGCTGASAPSGPTDFDTIVAAKKRIAGHIRTDVVNILESPGLTGYYMENARETLYQQMLVSLSAASGVSSVIQYPVGIQSPFTTPSPGLSGPNPPRFSGKIVPTLYAAPKQSSLVAVAGYYGAATAYLASSLLNVRGILATGRKVTYQQKTYTINTEDSLFTIAKFFKILSSPGDLSNAAVWMTWTGFIDGIGSQDIVNKGASFPLIKIERKVNSGDNLLLLSEFVGIYVGSFARANQSFKGILLKGTVIDIKNYSKYTVQSNDTLWSIVAAINNLSGHIAKTPLTIDQLAIYLRDKTGVLDTSKTLFCVQLLPDVTLSTTKVSLGAVGSAKQDPALSFLFTVKHPGRYQHLFMNLDYVINEVEYGIDNVPGVTGYQESSWLSFILPVGSGPAPDKKVTTAIPQVQVPLPLRSYPAPPTLAGQNALASKPGAATIPDAKLWDYRFDFESRNAAQDSNHVEVTFNHKDSAQSFAMFRTRNIFNALAEFIESAPSLVKDLALLPALATGAQNKTAALAVQALSLMAQNISYALAPAPNEDIFAEQWPQQTYGYKLQNFSDGSYYKELLLGIERSPTGTQYWPDIYVQSPTAPTAGTGPDAGFPKLTPKKPVGQTGFYIYPDGIPVGKKMTQRFRFTERDVIRNKNAWGGVFLTRNEDLIISGPLGITGRSTPYKTNPQFVYSTPLVRFINRQTPLINNQQSIAVNSLTGPSGPPAPQPRSLAAHLTNMLDALLEMGPASLYKAESYLEVLCRYAYSVSKSTTGPAGQLLAKTPIRLVPTFLIDGNNKSAFVNQLAQSLNNWKTNEGPTGNNGYLIFETSVFDKSTTGPSGGAEALKPILRLKDLQLPMDKILWNTTTQESHAEQQGPEGYKEWKP